MVSGIYKIMYNDLCLYVGQSKNIDIRIKKHTIRINSRTHLQNFNNFLIENNIYSSDLQFNIVEECEPCDLILNEREIYWFNNLRPLFYGKQPSTSESWEHSDETKQKIATKLIERYSSTRNRVYCKNCGNEFFAKPSTKRKFCSVHCSNKAKNKARRTLSKTQIKLIKYMRFSGMKLSDIATVFDTHPTKIHRVLKYDAL